MEEIYLATMHGKTYGFTRLSLYTPNEMLREINKGKLTYCGERLTTRIKYLKPAVSNTLTAIVIGKELRIHNKRLPN